MELGTPISSDFISNPQDYNVALLILRAMNRKRRPQHFFECLRKVPPITLYNLVKYSAPYTWFASTIHEEMLKRYEVVSYILRKGDSSIGVERLIVTCLRLWMELRPINSEIVRVTSNMFREAFNNNRPIKLVSLTCPAYTIGREGIAQSLIENRVSAFVDLVYESISPISDLISQWDIYIWDPSNLTDPILRKTIHPNLMKAPDLGSQLTRNWTLFNRMAEMVHNRLKIKIVCKRYIDLLPEIYAAKDILEELERKSKFHSKCLERMLRHGREDYRKMGEDIEEHRNRFWNDSYIYTGAILKYGQKNNVSRDLSIMLSIESRIHHITGLRLYHFEHGNDEYLMPVWNYPTWIRSFYWVNKVDDNVEQKISATRERWKRYEQWKRFETEKNSMSSCVLGGRKSSGEIQNGDQSGFGKRKNATQKVSDKRRVPL